MQILITLNNNRNYYPPPTRDIKATSLADCFTAVNHELGLYTRAPKSERGFFHRLPMQLTSMDRETGQPAED